MQPIRICEVSSNQLKINTEALKTVLDQVGDRKFVLYSVNGPTRTGKSFVLNYFIQYFESRKQNEQVSQSDADWTKFQPKSTFPSRGGRDRETQGIELWSQPYFIKTDDAGHGKEVAVLLMDTQGLFDEHTTALQNAFIMSISTLCSSVMIFNTMRLLNEDTLQHLQLFSNYASTAINHDEEAALMVTLKDGDLSPSVDLDTDSNKRSCQKLLFLIRDFELADYGYGLHDDDQQPKINVTSTTGGGNGKNYFKDTFRYPQDRHSSAAKAKVPEENILVRENILNNYAQVSVYTLPDPGKEFKRHEFEQNAEPDQDFKLNLKDFVEFLVLKENLLRNTKTFDGEEVTGAEFLAYFTEWAEECHCEKKMQDKFPPVHTMAESLAWTQYSITHSITFNSYKKQMNEFMSAHKDGAPMSQLTDQQLAAAESALKFFQTIRKVQNDKLHTQFENKLASDMVSYFTSLTALNKKRLELQKWKTSESRYNEKESGELSRKFIDEDGDSTGILKVKVGLNDNIDQMKAKLEIAEDAALRKNSEINCMCFLHYKEKLDEFLSTQDNNNDFFNNFKTTHTVSLESALGMYRSRRKNPCVKGDKEFEKCMRDLICKYYKSLSVSLMFAAAVSIDSNESDFYIEADFGCTESGDVCNTSLSSFQNAWQWVVASFDRLSIIWA